jgi:hypothetical protein
MLDLDEVRKRKKKKKKNLKPTELLVLVIGTPARHERLHLLRATWLRDVPHIFYSDAAASPQHVKSQYVSFLALDGQLELLCLLVGEAY